MFMPPASLHARLLSLDVPDAGPLHVLIVADDPFARAGLVALLTEQTGYTLTSTSTDDVDLGHALDVFQPDVILWDVGLVPTTDLTLFYDEPTPLVLLVPDESTAADAWTSGARAMLLRESAPTAIAAALVAAHQGLVILDTLLADSLLSLPVPLPETEMLTARERDVLALLAEGLPNKLIADRLVISEHTVKFHIGSILSKLNVHSRTEAVIHAARRGLLII